MIGKLDNQCPLLEILSVFHCWGLNCFRVSKVPNLKYLALLVTTDFHHVEINLPDLTLRVDTPNLCYFLFGEGDIPKFSSINDPCPWEILLTNKGVDVDSKWFRRQIKSFDLQKGSLNFNF